MTWTLPDHLRTTHTWRRTVLLADSGRPDAGLVDAPTSPFRGRTAIRTLPLPNSERGPDGLSGRSCVADAGGGGHFLHPTTSLVLSGGYERCDERLLPRDALRRLRDILPLMVFINQRQANDAFLPSWPFYAALLEPSDVLFIHVSCAHLLAYSSLPERVTTVFSALPRAALATPRTTHAVPAPLSLQRCVPPCRTQHYAAAASVGSCQWLGHGRNYWVGTGGREQLLLLDDPPLSYVTHTLRTPPLYYSG